MTKTTFRVIVSISFYVILCLHQTILYYLTYYYLNTTFYIGCLLSLNNIY
jgi:hypothetical protein